MRWRTVAGVFPVEGMDRARFLSSRTLASLSDEFLWDVWPVCFCLLLSSSEAPRLLDLDREVEVDVGMGLNLRADLSTTGFLFLSVLLDCFSGGGSAGTVTERTFSSMSIVCMETSTETSCEYEEMGLVERSSRALTDEGMSWDDRVEEVVDKPADE